MTDEKTAALLAEKAKIDQQLSDLAHNPDHQVFKPESPFSEGEEVLCDGIPAKVMAITGNATDGFEYTVHFSANKVVKADALKKLA